MQYYGKRGVFSDGMVGKELCLFQGVAVQQIGSANERGAVEPILPWEHGLHEEGGPLVGGIRVERGEIAKVLWGLHAGQVVIKLVHFGNRVPVIVVGQESLQEIGPGDKVCIERNDEITVGALY